MANLYTTLAVWGGRLATGNQCPVSGSRLRSPGCRFDLSSGAGGFGPRFSAWGCAEVRLRAGQALDGIEVAVGHVSPCPYLDLAGSCWLLLGVTHPFELACDDRADHHGVGRAGVIERTQLGRERIDLLSCSIARRLQASVVLRGVSDPPS